MLRSVRWVVSVAAAVTAFGLCLWLARAAPFAWMPQAESDRWVVATAFASVAAAAVGTGTGWWAGREAPPLAASPGRKVTQRARSSDRAQVTMVGGNQNAPQDVATSGSDTPGHVEQHAEASGDATVTQTAGDQHLGGSDGQGT